jgi:phosphatidate phosphatase LPIN
VRFGKFSLLRPYEKKVEFCVNNAKQDYAMKLGEGGEAFFVFETSDNIPEAMQTSPLVSPTSSPPLAPEGSNAFRSEPDFLDLDGATGKPRAGSLTRPGVTVLPRSSLRRSSNLSKRICLALPHP